MQWAKNVLSEDKLVTHVWCKICTKVMGKKRFLFPSLILFVNMLVGRKLLPQCSVFLKVHFTMLRIVNMLRKRCFMFPRVGKVCWIRLCRVWHMKASITSFNLPQFSTSFERQNPCLNMKAWKACCSSFSEELFTKTLVWQYWLVHVSNNAWHLLRKPLQKLWTLKITNYILIFCDEVTSVDN
jgi:hypothetical protein